MNDEDFIWLINALKRGSKDFSTLYNVSFNVKDLIIIDRGEPKQWFYMTPRKRIRQRDEEFLKFKVLREYFNNPNITVQQAIEIDSREPDYGQQFNNQKPQKTPYDNNYIFYFYTMHTRNSESFQVIRPVTRRVAQELLEKPSEYTEFLGQWQKVIAFEPLNKNRSPPQLYQVEFTQDFDSQIGKIVTIRKQIEGMPLTREEFLKSDQPKQLPKFEQKCYKSLSQIINEKCNDFVKAVVRFLQSQYKYIINHLVIDFFLAANGEIHLSGCPKLIFYDSYGEINNMDKNSMEVFKPQEKIEYKCPGIYCDSANIFYDENDEAFNLFIPQSSENSNQCQYIQQKSILLDVVERFKTIEYIQKVLENPNFDVTEQLIFRCKKYYSIGDLAGSQEFKRLRVDNYYERLRVCNYCFHMYSKLDDIRIQNLRKKKRQQVTPKMIHDTIQMLKGESGNIATIKMNDRKEKQRFSRQFKNKLKQFNIQQEEFQGEFNVDKKNDENYFYRSFHPENKTLYGEQNYLKDYKMNKKKLKSKSSQKFQLPKIQTFTLTDKNKMIHKRRYFVSPQDSEALGLKHYLGHTQNLPYSDCGLAISKSSLALNQLQDKIQEVQYLRQKIENDKVRQVREEIEMMLCPYYGNGTSDQQKLKEFVEALKKRENEEGNDEDEENRNKRVQVVTDKNEFLSENQKKQKMDKEQKDKDIEDQKKKFLEEHMELAESIVSKGLQSRKNKHYNKYQHSNTTKSNQYGSIIRQSRQDQSPSISATSSDQN